VKVPRFLTILIAFVGCLLLSSQIHAQTVYGYSDIYYDASSNTVVSTSETDLDYSIQAYYTAKVSGTLRDQNYTPLASGTRMDTTQDGFVDVVLQVTAQPGTQYTVVSIHTAIAGTYSVETGGWYNYYDYYNLEWFASEGIDYPDEFDFIGPGPVTTTRAPNISPGETTAWLSTSPITVT